MKNISILVVEDELSLLNRLVKYLSIFCDNIHQATNGKEALALYKKHLPNIIFTDINMPELTGIEFVNEIRKTDKISQIIILSAYTNTEDFLKVIPLNLVSYLVKPIQMQQLKETVLQAIDNLSTYSYVYLNNGYLWNMQTKSLHVEDKQIELSSYESKFIECLILKLNQEVSYTDIHYAVYEYSDFSQDAIFTLVKRIRKKTSKDFIKCCFKYGYKIESQL